MIRKLLCASFVFCFCAVTVGAAEEASSPAQLPPWAEPHIIKLAVEIGMREEQVPEFRAETGAFIESFYSMIKKEFRRNSVDKKRTIERRTRKLTKKLDKSMSAILDEAQIPAYENYRDALILRLSTPRGQRKDNPQFKDEVRHG